MLVDADKHIPKLEQILDSHEDFYNWVIEATMSGSTDILKKKDANPKSTHDCTLGHWIDDVRADGANKNLEIIKKINAEHDNFHVAATHIADNVGKKEAFTLLKDFESSRDKLSILLEELVSIHKQSTLEEADSAELDFDACSLSENFDQEDLDLVFFNLGTQEQRAELISSISSMEYDRAIQLLTLIICLLSKMDRDVESINDDFDRVSQLRNTLVDIEMQFVAHESKKEREKVDECQLRIERQLTVEQEADMYNSWLARMDGVD